MDSIFPVFFFFLTSISILLFFVATICSRNLDWTMLVDWVWITTKWTLPWRSVRSALSINWIESQRKSNCWLWTKYTNVSFIIDTPARISIYPSIQISFLPSISLTFINNSYFFAFPEDDQEFWEYCMEVRLQCDSLSRRRRSPQLQAQVGSIHPSIHPSIHQLSNRWLVDWIQTVLIYR